MGVVHIAKRKTVDNFPVDNRYKKAFYGVSAFKSLKTPYFRWITSLFFRFSFLENGVAIVDNLELNGKIWIKIHKKQGKMNDLSTNIRSFPRVKKVIHKETSLCSRG